MLFRILLPNGRVSLYSGRWDREDSPLGWRALVPSGSGGTTGIVVGVSEGETEREVIEFPDEAPLLNQWGLSLVEELSLDYLMHRGVLLFKLLPSAFLWKEEELLTIADIKPVGLDRKSLEIIEYVRKRRGVKPENLKKKYNPDLIKLLLKKGFLALKRSWRAPDVEEKFYRLNPPLKEALKKVRSKEKKRLLVFLAGKELVSEEELIEWGFKRRLLNELLREGLISLEREHLSRQRDKGKPSVELVKRVFGDRILIWSTFEKALQEIAFIAEQNLNRGHSTLILFPDYGELERSISALNYSFGDKLIEIHSRLQARRVYENWFRACREPVVVVGTYISMLCPAHSLSTVVLFDESSAGVKLRHVGNLDIRRASLILTKKLGASLVFTTPAPSLSSYYMVKKGRMNFEGEPPSPETTVIKRDPTEVLTEELYKQLKIYKDKDILFLVPKHGYSYVYCPRCETLSECPECGTFLTYSLKREELYCTRCRYQREELTCPECEGELEEVGFGLEKAVEVIEDNLGLEDNFHFSTHPHWESKHELVVILSADSLLSVPSYKAREELLLYLLKAKNVAVEKLFVQTLFPDEEVFKALNEGATETIYSKELEERERDMLPPFWRLLLIKTTNRELENYVFKVVSPNVKSTYNVRENSYELLVRFRERKTLWKVKQLLKRFSRDIIEVKVDPF